jgi:hypothetical protein
VVHQPDSIKHVRCCLLPLLDKVVELAYVYDGEGLQVFAASGRAGPWTTLAMNDSVMPGRFHLCCAVLCCAVLCCAVLCCAVLCCAVLCCGSWPAVTWGMINMH